MVCPNANDNEEEPSSRWQLVIYTKHGLHKCLAKPPFRIVSWNLRVLRKPIVCAMENICEGTNFRPLLLCLKWLL